jgi:alpha-glucosidase (family GH31 glycosyl hydrolase)
MLQHCRGGRGPSSSSKTTTTLPQQLLFVSVLFWLCLVVPLTLATSSSEVTALVVEADLPPFVSGATPITDVSGVPCVIFTNDGRRYLKVEILSENLAHFEVSENRVSLPCTKRIYSSLMVDKQDYKFSKSNVNVSNSASSWILKTSKMRLEISQYTQDLALSLYDISRGEGSGKEWKMTTLNYYDLAGPQLKTITMTSDYTSHIYGIGQQFVNPHGSSEGDWKTGYSSPGFWIEPDHCGSAKYGNKMKPWDCRATGLTQFPMGYFVKSNVQQSYGWFLDNQYYHDWNFGIEPMSVTSYGDSLRWFAIQGSSLAEIRRTYMELVGRPLVAPRRMFGLWISRFGYHNFGQLFDDLNLLREKDFPVDGFAFDLYWFGGTFDSPNPVTRMGTVSWNTDSSAFPDVAANIAKLEKEGGAGVMLISESYVSEGLKEFDYNKAKGYFAMKDGRMSFLDYNPWWGKGGMLDWSNPNLREFWFDNKYCALLNDCDSSKSCIPGICSSPKTQVTAWWNDLAEPEMFNCGQEYYGFTEDEQKRYVDEGSVHNYYAFFWAKTIYDGYQQHNVSSRPFTLIRSGTTGIQRFGGAMWSGDICSSLESLADHYDAHKHMSMVGLDYYCSDTGGYAVGAFPPNRDQLFTQWYANECWFAIPFRTHGDQLDQNMITNPAQVGDIYSNRFNTRLRYELVPYYYSLAHQAYLYGEPIIPPVFYHFQNDPNVHGVGSTKMIGKYFWVGISTQYTQTSRDMYLPAGSWYNYHTNEFYYFQTGSVLSQVSQLVKDRFDPSHTQPVLSLAAFVRAGAIFPKAIVRKDTMNVFGQLKNGSYIDNAEYIIRAYGDAVTPRPAEVFTVYEDDGVSNAYREGSVMTTRISNLFDFSQRALVITVFPSNGTFPGAPRARETRLEIVISTNMCPTFSSVVANVDGNQIVLKRRDNHEMQNWWEPSSDQPNEFMAHLQVTSVKATKKFVFQCTSR